MANLCIANSLLLGVTLLVTSHISNAQSPQKVSSEILMKTNKSWDGESYHSYVQGTPELSILKIIIPAHTTLGWHSHPIPNAAYVLSGNITVEKKSDSSKKRVFAGETLAETVGTVHRGITHDEPVTLIVFYAGKEGLPLSEPLPQK